MRLQTNRLVIKNPDRNELQELSQLLKEPLLLHASNLMLPTDGELRLAALRVLAQMNHLLIIKTSQVVGLIMLSPSYDRTGRRISHQYELGYVLVSSCWGKGLMPEALQAVLKVIPPTIKILAECRTNNYRSQRVLQKCGFNKISEELWCY